MGVVVPDGFVLKSQDVERIEAELVVLDHILRETAGPAARIERRWKGLPGRLVEARRPDGVTFGLIVAPIVRGPLGREPVRYIVTPFAHVKLGGLERLDGAEAGAEAENGKAERAEWRQVPVWTIELSRPESLHQARAAITAAWGRGSTVRRTDIASSEGLAGER